jgi:hypothetical protein
MDQSVWMKFCSSLPIETHAMSLWFNVFEWSSVQFKWRHWKTHTKCHHPIMGQMCLDETHTGNPIMDESFWMKLSSHWAMSSWVETFGWNSVHTGQCHHGSKCLDENQFTLDNVIMDHKVWLEFCSHCAIRSWMNSKSFCSTQWSRVDMLRWKLSNIQISWFWFFGCGVFHPLCKK